MANARRSRANAARGAALSDYRGLLKEAVAVFKREWEDDVEISRSNLVDWFSEWRTRAQATLKQNGDGAHYRELGLGEFDLARPVTPAISG